jgi:hypothetical protein
LTDCLVGSSVFKFALQRLLPLLRQTTCGYGVQLILVRTLVYLDRLYNTEIDDPVIDLCLFGYGLLVVNPAPTRQSGLYRPSQFFYNGIGVRPDHIM